MKNKIAGMIALLEKSLYKHGLLYVAGINLLFVIAAYAADLPYNETNDDTGMAAIASGAYGGERDCLIFSNVIWGKFLQLFYALPVTVNWYSVWQFLLTFSAFCVIGYIFTAKIGGIRALFIYVIFLKYFYYDFYLIYQFTRVSMLCCLAGYLLIFYALCKDRNWKLALPGGVFVFLGYLVRVSSFREITIFACSIGVCLILFNPEFYPVKEHKAAWKKGTAVFALLFAAILGANLYQGVSADDAWAQYREYNHMRAVISDYGWPDPWPEYEQYQQDYTAMGISENDCSMYRAGNFSDTEVLDPHTVERMYKFKKTYIRDHAPGIWDYIQFLCSYTAVSQVFFIHLMILAVLWIFYKRSCYHYLACMNLLVYMMISAYMFYNNRIVDRVMIPTNLALITISLFCLDQSNEKKYRVYGAQQNLLIWICLFLVLMPGKSCHYDDLKNSRKDAQALYQALDDKTRLFAAGHDVFRWNYYFFSAYQTIPEDFYCNQLNMGGWLARTPTLENVKKRNGIENNFRALLERNNMYYYTDHSEKMVGQYLKEHYSKGNVGYSICDTTPICKFIKYSENFSDTKDWKYGSMELASMDLSKEHAGYADLSADFRVRDRGHKIIGKNTKFYLEIANRETGECYTYFFRDQLKDRVLKEDNTILFTVPLGQAFRSLEELWESCEIRGIIEQEGQCYAIYEESS